jgi:hypothetical protein
MFFVDPNIQRIEKRKRSFGFRMVRDYLEKALDGVIVGVYDEKAKLLEIDSRRVYRVSELERNDKMIRSGIERGVVSKGRVNQMKYMGEEINI